MKTKIYHGDIQPTIFAKALIAEFNRGNLEAQQTKRQDGVYIQIGTRSYRQSGGQTGISVAIQKVADGVSVALGDHSVLGVAASLGSTAISALRNPFNLISRLDDVAQDIESLQLDDRVWDLIERVAAAEGASTELSERLRRLVCEFCETANPIGESGCIACGAPLGNLQPGTCQHCGFIVRRNEHTCPHCKKSL